MQTVIFCFSFFFLTTVAGFRQQWQTVDKMALKLIFGNISILTPLDFAIAAKYEDVAAQCNAYAEVFNDIDPVLDASWIIQDPNPMQAKMNMTFQGCKDYFTHRQWVQRWADFLFHELTVDYGDGSKELILKPWHSAQLKSIFWFIDSKYHYVFSCTMLKFIEAVVDAQDDVPHGISFMKTVKSIQDQYAPETFGFDDPKEGFLFKIQEQQLRGTGSYFYDLLSQDFIKTCTYESDSISDFSPNSWQNALTELGLAKKKK